MLLELLSRSVCFMFCILLFIVHVNLKYGIWTPISATIGMIYSRLWLYLAGEMTLRMYVKHFGCVLMFDNVCLSSIWAYKQCMTLSPMSAPMSANAVSVCAIKNRRGNGGYIKIYKLVSEIIIHNGEIRVHNGLILLKCWQELHSFLRAMLIYGTICCYCRVTFCVGVSLYFCKI